MKEVNLRNPAFGKDKKDRDSSVKNIVSELTIIKEQVCLMDSSCMYGHSAVNTINCEFLYGKLHGGKGPGGVCWQPVEHEPAVCPGRQEGQLHPGLYQE